MHELIVLDFEVPQGRNVSIWMPKHAKILGATLVDDQIMISALVPPCMVSEEREFTVVSANMPLLVSREPVYIASVRRKAIIHHIFEGNW